MAICFLTSFAACRNRSRPEPTKSSCEDPLEPPTPDEVLDPGAGGPLAVRIETSLGKIDCELDRAGAPRATALFVGLATGRARWRDPSGALVHGRPLYQDLLFFRAIEDVLVQSGSPRNDGTGDPGYRIAVEPRPDDALRLSQPGALALVRYHPPPNRPDPHPPPPGAVIGSQFVITLSNMHHLAGQVTVIGRCEDLDVVGRIAREVVSKRRPVLRSVSMQSARPP